MRLFRKEEKWKNSGGVINILTDISEKDIKRILAEPNLRLLQLFQFKNPNDKTWKTLNEIFNIQPNLGIRIVWNEINDFSFFNKIQNVRSFTIASFNTKDFSALVSNSKLTHFGIEETKSKSVDISFVENFNTLKSLHIDGMKKGIESVQKLEPLEKLTLRGIKKDNLDFLRGLENLNELKLQYGHYENLSALLNHKHLKSLELSRVKNLLGLDFLNSMSNLETLELEGLSKLESIPTLDKLTNLRKLLIRNNLRLNSIKQIARIPNLKALHLSFSESSKAAERKNLLNQAVELILKSKSIQYTNIIQWTDKTSSEQLRSKGIKKWTHDMNL